MTQHDRVHAVTLAVNKVHIPKLSAAVSSVGESARLLRNVAVLCSSLTCVSVPTHDVWQFFWICNCRMGADRSLKTLECHLRTDSMYTMSGGMLKCLRCTTRSTWTSFQPRVCLRKRMIVQTPLDILAALEAAVCFSLYMMVTVIHVQVLRSTERGRTLDCHKTEVSRTRSVRSTIKTKNFEELMKRIASRG